MDISANRSFVLHLPRVVELAREAMGVLDSSIKSCIFAGQIGLATFIAANGLANLKLI